MSLYTIPDLPTIPAGSSVPQVTVVNAVNIESTLSLRTNMLQPSRKVMRIIF